MDKIQYKIQDNNLRTKPTVRWMTPLRNKTEQETRDIVNERCLETIFVDSPVDPDIARMIRD